MLDCAIVKMCARWSLSLSEGVSAALNEPRNSFPGGKGANFPVNKKLPHNNRIFKLEHVLSFPLEPFGTIRHTNPADDRRPHTGRRGPAAARPPWTPWAPTASPGPGSWGGGGGRGLNKHGASSIMRHHWVAEGSERSGGG